MNLILSVVLIYIKILLFFFSLPFIAAVVWITKESILAFPLVVKDYLKK